MINFFEVFGRRIGWCFKKRSQRVEIYPRARVVIPSHYAVGIIFMMPEGKSNSGPLILSYKGKKRNSDWIYRLPGSRQQGIEGYFETLGRACEEKLGIASDLLRWKRCVILYKFIRGEKVEQVVFFADATGKILSLRKETKTLISEKYKTLKEEWMAPEWIPLSEAVNTNKLFFSHKALLLSSLQSIQGSNPVYGQFMNFNRVNVIT